MRLFCLRKLLPISFLAIWASGTLSVYAQAEPDSTLSPLLGEAVFIEIELTETGVVATDANDMEWSYDFDLEAFVPFEGYRSEVGRSVEVSVEDDRSIAERCVVPLVVDPFETEVTVGRRMYVDGDIEALGEVVVMGWVKGSILSKERVIVRPTGQVDGDIEAPVIDVQPGGTVLGQVKARGISSLGRPFAVSGVIIVASFTAFLLLFTLIVTTLAPRQVKQFEGAYRGHSTKSFLIGLLATLMMPLVAVAVAITIVGTILIPIIPLIYAIAYFLGIVACGGRLGRYILSRSSDQEDLSLSERVVGVSAFMALWFLVSVLLGSNSDVAFGFGIFALVVACIVSAWAVFSGAGAALLTRFGFRAYVGWAPDQAEQPSEPAPPAPPPMPEPPKPSSSPPPVKPGGTDK